jgi:hypothetical protein
MLETQGTSFAAPLVTHGLAELSALLGAARGSGHALRAFAAHFAELRPNQSKKRYGHGRIPESFVDLWECRPDEVTVLYQASLPRGGKTAMYLPLPPGLPPDAEVSLRWTLCYTSDVDPNDATEYTRSGFEVYFRPHFNRRSLTDRASGEPLGVYDIVEQRDEIARLMGTRNIQWSDTPVSESGWRAAHEGALRNAGKWETLSQGQRVVAAEHLLRPRIDLNHLARGAGVLQSAADVGPLPVSLLVSLRAAGISDFYDRACVAHRVLVPLAQEVEVAVQLAG